MSIVIPTIHHNDVLLDECLAAIRATCDVHTIIADRPVSFAVNCNDGAVRSSGDLIVFLNDDTVPQPGWYDQLVGAFDDPDVGIAGARLTYPDGTLQHAGVHFTVYPLTAWNTLTDEPSRDVSAVTGACLAIRRDLFFDLNGFDAGYVNGYEDVDLCLRARGLGARIRYVRESHVVHHESQSGPQRWANVAANVARLQERWVVSSAP